eukprot:Rhum_TRINITY_DN14756_c7_g1::Rhum_TRINITY_DN14756_c7_g1_i1::g.114852::m.114852
MTFPPQGARVSGNRHLDHLGLSTAGQAAANKAQNADYATAMEGLAAFLLQCGDSYVSFSDEAWAVEGAAEGDDGSEAWRRRLCVVTQQALYVLPYPEEEYAADEASRFHLGNIAELVLPTKAGQDRVVTVLGCMQTANPQQAEQVFRLVFQSSVKAHQFCLSVSNIVHAVRVTHRGGSLSPVALRSDTPPSGTRLASATPGELPRTRAASVGTEVVRELERALSSATARDDSASPPQALPPATAVPTLQFEVIGVVPPSAGGSDTSDASLLRGRRPSPPAPSYADPAVPTSAACDFPPPSPSPSPQSPHVFSHGRLFTRPVARLPSTLCPVACFSVEEP